MSSAKEVLINALIYFVGNIGSKLIFIVLLPIYSFFLTKSDMGVYDLMLTAVNISVPIGTLQISQAVYRFLLGDDISVFGKKEIITNGFIVITILLIIFILFLFLVTCAIKSIEYINYYYIIVILTSYFFFFQQVARGNKQTKAYTVSSLINAFNILVFNIIFVWLIKFSIEWVFLSMILSLAVSALYLILKTHVISFIDVSLFSIKKAKYLIFYSSPLVLNTISWWLISFANKFIIYFYIGLEANGIYAISSRIPSLINLLASIFMLSWQDFIIENKKSNSTLAFSEKLLFAYSDFIFSVVFLFIPASYLFNEIFISEGFVDSWRYMPFLAVASAFSSLSGFFGAIHLKEKETKQIFYTSFFGGLSSILISVMFISNIGLYSPAIGSMVGFFVVFLMRIISIRSVYPLKVSYIRIIFWLLACFVSFCLLSLNQSLLSDIILLIFSLVIFFIINASIIKKSFYLLLGSVRKR